MKRENSAPTVLFDFSDLNSAAGLPRALVRGSVVDIFDVPIHVCPDDRIAEALQSFGVTQGVAHLGWLQSWHADPETGQLDSPIRSDGATVDLPGMIRQLQRKRFHDAHFHFFARLQAALEHAATARGDASQDLMAPERLRMVTPETIEAALHAALRGEPYSLAPGLFNFRELQ